MRMIAFFILIIAIPLYPMEQPFSTLEGALCITIGLLTKNNSKKPEQSVEDNKKKCESLINPVISNNQELVEHMLAHGVPANLYDESGPQPIHWAVISGNLALVITLVKHGA